jgi:hypothetical protein
LVHIARNSVLTRFFGNNEQGICEDLHVRPRGIRRTVDSRSYCR